MKPRSFIARIEQLEEAARLRSKFSPDCICFPEKEGPFFAYLQQERIAGSVKCPLHGDRFGPRRPNIIFIYVSKWYRKKQAELLWISHSEKYRKAWFASFPPELWMGEEVEIEGREFLVLNDGSRLSLDDEVWIAPFAKSMPEK